MLGITDMFPPVSHGRKRKIDRRVHERVLSEDLLLDQWIVPKGTTVRTTESTNFGYVILPPGTEDKRGFRIPRRIFRY
jgi:hypothetical protein